MNPDVKALWTAALRSGDYKQGRAVLCEQLSDGTYIYCCLGVLCDVAVKKGVIPPGKFFGGTTILKYGQENNGGVLPAEVIEWAGLEEANPIIGEPLEEKQLAYLNDYTKKGFGEIANMIDEYL